MTKKLAMSGKRKSKSRLQMIQEQRHLVERALRLADRLEDQVMEMEAVAELVAGSANEKVIGVMQSMDAAASVLRMLVGEIE